MTGWPHITEKDRPAAMPIPRPGKIVAELALDFQVLKGLNKGLSKGRSSGFGIGA